MTAAQRGAAAIAASSAVKSARKALARAEAGRPENEPGSTYYPRITGELLAHLRMVIAEIDSTAGGEGQ